MQNEYTLELENTTQDLEETTNDCLTDSAKLQGLIKVTQAAQAQTESTLGIAADEHRTAAQELSVAEKERTNAQETKEANPKPSKPPINFR